MNQPNPQPIETDLVENTAAAFRILVVDDSRLQRRILCATLETLGYAVLEAETALQALKICRNDMPDMVISDWIMPGLSGLEFCRAFREISGEAYRYFILLTSKSEKAEIAEGLDAGADDFLIKPVDTHELRARIVAGERIVRMQHELSAKNRLISDTLEELQRVHEQINRDLLDAKRLQQSLIPVRHETWEEGTLSLLLRSSGHVGGDLVGFFPTDDGKLGIYAIDVSGHGISSALMTARLAGHLSSSSPDQNVALRRRQDGAHVARKPNEVVSTLNALVLNEMETEHYFTMAMAFIDLRSGEVVLSQAGHPHPVIQRRDGTVEFCGTGGFPVGLLPDTTHDCFSVRLQAGDRLILLSDGVTECHNTEGALLGETGLSTILRDLGGARGLEFFDMLIWRLAAFAGTDDFADDISGVLFDFTGPLQDR